MITLKVTKLTKSFGDNTVFSEISFAHEGKTLGIAGSNGSGKSTFLKSLSGLLQPSKGTINWYNSGDEIPIPHFKKMLGYAAPYINLYNELSCRENLSFLVDVRHQKTDEKELNYWIDKVELTHVADQPFGKLSTGQQQRLRLASALFHDPKILMLDEPGSNLDEAGRTLIHNIAESFQSPEKMLIIASNSPEELQLCENIFSIEQEAFE
ncbi:ABC transporter ATP-binding protein [Fodinibius saliphilus]|uniref:ABC transporter ATP-binding protein n=1 Tax=Fodinibius saliphilus TaxID=1920650 RepID=UPI001486DACA|nr:ABC transporter ATP-binding protein [Fodinibius saliphilus]